MLRVSSSHESFEIVYASSEFESRVRKICGKLGEFESKLDIDSSFKIIFKNFGGLIIQLYFKKTQIITRNSKILRI